MIVTAIAGIVLGLSLPGLMEVSRREVLHECADRIDRFHRIVFVNSLGDLALNPEAILITGSFYISADGRVLSYNDNPQNCPASAEAYATDTAGKPGMCCPTPGDHRVDSLCKTSPDAELAPAYPVPSRTAWRVYGFFAVGSGVLFLLTLSMNIALIVGGRFRSPGDGS